MSVPLYQAKTDFLRMLVPLQDGPLPARDLLTAIETEPSGLSQQPAVLRRSGIVTSTREGATGAYELAGGDAADLLKAARRILTEVPAGRNELPAEPRGAEVVAR
ncbi:transcriptional regulator [Streptomyces canus]|uniref:transcriptional regulator n=1 Tax=Streptomyces canus TaxID=58343 RepID=UPI0030E0DF29